MYSISHGVWKSQKKSHSSLRAKRATFTFWMDKSSWNKPKMVHFNEFLKTWSLRSNSVTREVPINRTKIDRKCQNGKNSNETFWVICKHCVSIEMNGIFYHAFMNFKKRRWQSFPYCVPYSSIVFENFPKYLIWVTAFSPIFVQSKLACLVTLFDRKIQVFKKLAKIDHFWHFYWTFVHSKRKCSSLRSQFSMRLFLWFSNTLFFCPHVTLDRFQSRWQQCNFWRKKDTCQVAKLRTTYLGCLKITEKSLLQHCGQSELGWHFEWTKVH